MTELEAERFMDKFKAEYPGVRMFLNKCVALARRSGLVETIAGFTYILGFNHLGFPLTSWAVR